MGLCLDRSPLHRIGGLSHRGDRLAQAILTVAPSRLGVRWGQGPAWFYEPLRRRRRAFCDSDIAIHEPNRPLMDADAIVFDRDCVPAPVVNDFPPGLK